MQSRSRVRLLVVTLTAALVAAFVPPPSPVRAVAPPPVAVARDAPPLDLLNRIERLGVVDSVTEVPRLGAGAALGSSGSGSACRSTTSARTAGASRLRATLVHRGADRPTVMATSGYNLGTWDYGYRYEVTRIVRGNQLDLEHRFFKPSRPSRPDWATQLTIRQAATDQHLIVRAMKRIYDRRWLSTGHSKGGMTMTYHRRFYPGDVNAHRRVRRPERCRRRRRRLRRVPGRRRRADVRRLPGGPGGRAAPDPPGPGVVPVAAGRPRHSSPSSAVRTGRSRSR